MTKKSTLLRKKLSSFGFSNPVIEAAWPDWWSNEAEDSASAQAELRFSLARKLGLEANSLLDEGNPRFIWRDEAKFKNLTAYEEQEQAALASFGIPIGRALVRGGPDQHSLPGKSAQELRNSILSNQDYVRFVDLLGLCWAVGIPIIFLRVFPLTAKRMCAMTVKVDQNYAILLGKDSQYPAPIAYYIAHELGHIALRHLKNSSAIVDFEDPLQFEDSDEEEKQADAFALELLTGRATPEVLSTAKRFTAAQFAQTALEAAKELKIEPGTLSLCYGHSTGDWEKTFAAMKYIYSDPKDVWKEVNKVAHKNINWDKIPEDFHSYLSAVMGGSIN